MKFDGLLRFVMVCAILSTSAFAKVSDSKKVEVVFEKKMNCVEARNILRKQSFIVQCANETAASDSFVAVYFGTAELNAAVVAEIPFVSGLVFGLRKNQVSSRSTASIR